MGNKCSAYAKGQENNITWQRKGGRGGEGHVVAVNATTTKGKVALHNRVYSRAKTRRYRTDITFMELGAVLFAFPSIF